MMNSRLTKIAAISAIVLVIVFNLGYWVVWPALSRPAPPPAESMRSADGDIIPSQPVPEAAPLVNETQLAVAAGVIVVVLAIGVASLIGFLSWQKKQGQKQDENRKQALQKLAEGMAAYQKVVGHYPVSLREQHRTLPAVGLGYEWEDLGFPNANEMRQYIAAWPLIDPEVPFDRRDQTNQYIYYPIGNGQNFALYAHLESVSQAGPDYNRIDGLPRAWGQYNYRVGTPMQVQAAPPVQLAAVPHSTPAPSGSSVGSAIENSSATIPENPPTATLNTPAANSNPEQILTPEEIMKLGAEKGREPRN